MTEPVKVTKGASASDIIESLSWLGEEIEKKARADVRQECSDMFRDNYLDRSKTSVRYSLPLDDQIIADMRLVAQKLSESRFIADKDVAGQMTMVADSFDNSGVSFEFKLAMRFCVEVLNNTEFEL